MGTLADERAALVARLGMAADNTNLSMAQLWQLECLPLAERLALPMFNEAGLLSAGVNDTGDTFDAALSSLLTVGEETIPRIVCTGAYNLTTSGVIGFTEFTARKTEVSTQCRINTASTAAAATPTLVKMGVYSVAPNGDLTLVASTASDTTLFAAANTTYTRSWVTPFTKVAGQRYAFAVIVVSAAAIPTFSGIAMALNMTAESNISPRFGYKSSVQTDLPATLTSAVAVTTINPAVAYAAVLP